MQYEALDLFQDPRLGFDKFVLLMKGFKSSFVPVGAAVVREEKNGIFHEIGKVLHESKV